MNSRKKRDQLPIKHSNLLKRCNGLPVSFLEHNADQVVSPLLERTFSTDRGIRLIRLVVFSINTLFVYAKPHQYTGFTCCIPVDAPNHWLLTFRAKGLLTGRFSLHATSLFLTNQKSPQTLTTLLFQRLIVSVPLDYLRSGSGPNSLMTHNIFQRII